MLASIFKQKTMPLLQEYFYGDYEKIQLVQGDNQKQEDAYRFIVKKTDAAELFGGANLDFPEYFVINSEAFNKKDAYEFI